MLNTILLITVTLLSFISQNISNYEIFYVCSTTKKLTLLKFHYLTWRYTRFRFRVKLLYTKTVRVCMCACM